jgi:transketolase
VTKTATDIDIQSINTIRCLAADAVQQANSGHPGAPMGMAPMAYVLWTRFLKHNPSNPQWVNRDRFVLSAGHASALIYCLLHLSGYKVSLDDIKQFRQWGSLTPGHPEYGVTPGVETTTGPLGQGFSNSVGMAIAERYLSDYFNQKDTQPLDHYTYAIVSDGDLMEGISYEAASMAGHQKLGKLICLYDDNNITIDGELSLSFSEDVTMRFKALGWHVQSIEDGNTDLDGIEAAIRAAQDVKDQPSIIRVKTTIGFGSPNKSNDSASHGAPLGADEVAASKKSLECEDKDFYIPAEVLAQFRKAIDQGQAYEADWKTVWSDYESKYADKAKEWQLFFKRELPENLSQALPQFKPEDGAIATRSASGKALNALSAVLPNLVSGCADLAGSVNTLIKDGGYMTPTNPLGRNIAYGIREHAMGAILNGMALHGGMMVCGGTFLIFSDYMKASIRLAALMKLPVVYLFSHDSIGVGEDGPTHQPIEQLAGLRAIPNLNVIRPCDANETSSAWREAINRKTGPTALILSRQKLPTLKLSVQGLTQGVTQGAQIVHHEERSGTPDLILMASGSEVSLCVEAAKILEVKKLSVRVVSMSCWEIFRTQTAKYQQMILDPNCKKRFAVEAAATQGWHEFVGQEGGVHGMTRFGASAPGDVLAKEFGFTPENIADKAMQLLV